MRLQLEPLPGDVVDLLLRGATQLEPSAHTRQKLRERLAPLVPDPASSRSVALAPWGSLGALATGATRSRFLIGVASFALGIGTASSLRTPPPVLVPAIASVSLPAPAPLAVAPAPLPAVVASHAHRTHAPGLSTAPTAAVIRSTPSQPPEPILQLEGELLEKGRIAMVRGDADGAFAAVDEHLARFPHGALVEEREALRIEALVAADRDPEARAAFGAFRRTYPQSLVGPALAAALGVRL